MQNKPIQFLILKLLGVSGVAISVLGVISVLTGFQEFDPAKFLRGMLSFPASFITGVVLLMAGFMPEISSFAAKTHKDSEQEDK